MRTMACAAQGDCCCALFFVFCACRLAGIGAVPWALKYALNQEVRNHAPTSGRARRFSDCLPSIVLARCIHLQKPARKDQFERYVAWKGDVYDAEAAPYANTHEFKLDREAMENEWRAAHAAKLA